MEQDADDPGLEYRPVNLPRRGEIVAWMLAIVAIAAWVILARFGEPIFIGLKILAIIFALSAPAISLGNWTDRKTRLILKKNGVFFENGLRRVSLNWGEIRKIEVIPTSWGSKVRLFADSGHFGFWTLGEVRLQGELKGRMGFVKGEEILHHILSETGLKEIPSLKQNRYYS